MGNTNNVQRQIDRAIQFAPFAALAGYKEAIEAHIKGFENILKEQTDHLKAKG